MLEQWLPYRHCFVKCSFQNSGDLKQTQAGDEISVYFYANGSTMVVAFDEYTVKKKILQQITMIVVLLVVMSFLIPVVGLIVIKKFGS